MTVRNKFEKKEEDFLVLACLLLLDWHDRKKRQARFISRSYENCDVKEKNKRKLAIMANPRKFSEKIALHTQKQAEETAAFERIMREVSDATNKVGLSPIYSGNRFLAVKSAHRRKQKSLQNALLRLNMWYC